MKRALDIALRQALAAMGVEPPATIEIEIPRDASHGDLSTPVAMGMARQLKRAPRQIADTIIANMPKEAFSRVEVAGPGFINVTISPAFLQSELRRLLTEGSKGLRIDSGKGRRIQVEYVSANPTGPLHLGHGRGAAVGHALCNILEAAGYSVTREYYVNDAGRQVSMLGQSVYARYQERFGIEVPFPEDGYRGDYVIEIADALKTEDGDRHKGQPYEGATEKRFVDYALGKMLKVIKDDLAKFYITFDTWQSERELYATGAVQHAIDHLKSRGLMYEHEGALWFKATAFGDDKDRVVIKQDGQPTYFASDIAYHLKKAESGYDELIDIWGADHHGYIPRLGAVMDAIGAGKEKLRVLLIQMVSLMRGGQPVMMSKRAGDFVTLSDLINEVGSDTTKFIFLTRRHDSQLAFDIDAALARSSENPVFYVQYANARIHSIFARAKDEGIDTGGLTSADLSPLASDEELGLIRKLLMYPGVLEQSAEGREPHKLTFYLQELAGLFHPWYKTHRVIDEAPDVRSARMALCEAVALVIRDGLTLLGLSAPDRM